MTKHKVLKTIMLGIVGILVIAIAGGAIVFYPQLKAAASVKKLDDGLYTLTYEGDYGFPDFLKQGGADSDARMADYIIGFLTHGLWKSSGVDETERSYGCSTLTVQAPKGGVLFGRNYDWQDCDVMIVKTKPKDGYASVSTCCLTFLGFGDGWVPEGIANQMMALAAVYVPLDGMNEKGLCIADLMAGDKTETHQQSDKSDVTTVSAIRLLLDGAATVDEAIALLAQYDMHSSIGTAHHFALADASGKSVVVEYIENQMCVTETPVVTNFYITEGDLFGIGSEQSHIRFDALTDALHNANGSMNKESLLGCMAAVSQSNYPESRGDESTQWTLVCDTKNQAVNFYFREAFDHPYTVSVSD